MSPSVELMRAMLKGLYRNPLDPREWVLLDKNGYPLAGVVMRPLDPASWGPNHIHMEELRAMKKGGGRKLMGILVKRADELGVTLSGVAKPLESPVYGRKMPARKLKDWYRQFGFDVDGDDIIRYPGGR